MNKIGAALALYNSRGFDDAYKALCEKYKKYLSDDEAAQLAQVEASIKEKTDKLEKFVKKMNKSKGVYPVNLFSKRNGQSQQFERSTFLNVDKDGNILNRNMFGLFWDIQCYQNVMLLVAEDDRFDDDYNFKGLAKLVGSKIDSNYGTSHFLYIKKSMVPAYQKVFDVSKVLNVSEMIDAEKLRRKTERKIARTGERVEAAEAKLFSVVLDYGREISYNEALQLAQSDNKKIVIQVRDASHRRDRDVVSSWNIPTDKASEKTFTTSDVDYTYLDNGLVPILSKLEKKDSYLVLMLTPANYKRLKLWRDPTFLLETDVIKELLTELAQSVPTIKSVKYSDKLLNEESWSDNWDTIDSHATEEDKKTAFYKRLAMAYKTLDKRASLLQDSKYDNIKYFARSFRELKIQSPIESTEAIEQKLFADYPMLDYTITGWRDRIDSESIHDVFDYARLVEASKASC